MNMKKTSLLYAFLPLFSTSFLTAGTIVTIKGGDIVQKSKSGKKIHEKLEKEQEKLTKNIKEDEQKIKAKEAKVLEDKKKLEKEAADIQKNNLLSAKAKEEKINELQNKARDVEDDKNEVEKLIKRFQQDAQRVNEKMSKLYQEEMSKFDANIKDVIKDVAKKENWDLVLMEESVVYAKDSVSKTDMIINELDKSEKLKLD